MKIRYNILLDEYELKIPLEIIKVPFVFDRGEESTKKLLESILKKLLY